MAIVTRDRPGEVSSVGKVDVIDLDLGVQKASMTLVAGGVRRLGHPRKGDGPLGMALCAGGLLPLMAFKTSLFWGSEGGRNFWVMIDIVMAGGTGIVQQLNVELVGYFNLQRVIFIVGWFILNQILMATSAIRIYPVDIGGKPDFRLPGL
jgi:hypothetical protein